MSENSELRGMCSSCNNSHQNVVTLRTFSNFPKFPNFPNESDALEGSFETTADDKSRIHRDALMAAKIIEYNAVHSTTQKEDAIEQRQNHVFVKLLLKYDAILQRETTRNKAKRNYKARASLMKEFNQKCGTNWTLRDFVAKVKNIKSKLVEKYSLNEQPFETQIHCLEWEQIFLDLWREDSIKKNKFDYKYQSPDAILEATPKVDPISAEEDEMRFKLAEKLLENFDELESDTEATTR